MNDNEMQVIATIRTDFPTKFGIPRQSGIVDTLRAKIVFEPASRCPARLGGFFACVADLAVFRQCPQRNMVTDCAPAAARR